MTSKIKRAKTTCPKRQVTKKPTPKAEPWWERLSRSKRTTPCNTDLFRSFNWWRAQKECHCTRNCVHQTANRLSAGCVDLQASAARLSKPRSACPSVLSADRSRFRSFNWWRACRARERLIPPITRTASLMAGRRRRVPGPLAAGRGSDSSSTAERVYRTFSWWRPSRARCGPEAAGRGRLPGRSRSLSLDARSLRSDGGNGRLERRERSLSPSRRHMKSDLDADADADLDPARPSLFRSFSWWQLPTGCLRSESSFPPTKLRRKVSFNFGEGDASGDSSPGAGDVTPGWKRTVVDSRLREQRTVPAQSEPHGQRTGRGRQEQRAGGGGGGGGGARDATTGGAVPAAGGGGGDKQATVAGRARKTPENTKDKRSPQVAAKGSKSEGSTVTKKSSPQRAKSPGRSKSPGKDKLPGRAKSPGRSKSPGREKPPERVDSPGRPKSPTGRTSRIRPGSPRRHGVRFPGRSPSPAQSHSDPEPPAAAAPLKSESESADSDYTESSLSTDSASAASHLTSGAGTGSQRTDGSSSGRSGPAAGRQGVGVGRRRGSPRPASAGRRGPRPGSARRTGPVSPSQSETDGGPGPGTGVMGQQTAGRPEEGKGWLAVLCGATFFGALLLRMAANPKMAMAAGLSCLLVGYTSVNHWEYVEELLGIGPEGPCGRPENTYFCI